MPRYHVVEIRYKTKTILPCKEKRRGMTDDEAAEESARQLVQIGRNIRDLHKRNLARQYPPASRPGYYPARRTGSLKNGIFSDPEKTIRISRKGDARVTVGYSNKNSKNGKNPYWYGPYLVNQRGRLGIMSTINSQEGRNILNSTWKSVEFRQINRG